MKKAGLDVRLIPESSSAETALWISLDGALAEATQWLQDNVQKISSIGIDAITAEETRPRLEVIEGGYFLIVRGANYNEGEERQNMVSLRLWFDEKGVVSVQKQKLLAVELVSENALRGAVTTTGGLVSSLAYHLAKNMNRALADLSDRTDDVEDRILSDPSSDHRQDVILIRHEIVAFRRHIVPQVDALEELIEEAPSFFTKKDIAVLQEALNSTKRYIENLESMRERSQILQEEMASYQTESLNKRMYIVAVLSAFFLPLGFLVGLLGVNLSGIPWADNSHSFYGLIGLIAFVSLVIGAFMRWSRWL